MFNARSPKSPSLMIRGAAIAAATGLILTGASLPGAQASSAGVKASPVGVKAAPAASAKTATKTVSTGWSWAGGGAVKAKTVGASQAKALGGAGWLKVKHSTSRTFVETATTASGQLVGLDRGAVKLATKTGAKTYMAGLKGASFVFVSGDTVYAVASVKGADVLYRGQGVGKKPTKLGKIPGKAALKRSYAGVQGGRLFWTQRASVTSVHQNVMSMPVAGGATRTEGKDVVNPVFTAKGVYATQRGGGAADQDAATFRGIVKLSGGKATRVLKYNDSTTKAGVSRGLIVTSGQGNTLVINKVGGPALVLDLRTHKAYRFASGAAAAGNGVVAWTPNDVYQGRGASKSLYALDVKKGALRSVATGQVVDAVFANGRAVGSMGRDARNTAVGALLR